MELDNVKKGYDKVVKDWNMQDKHNGFNVAHGSGLWAIKHSSATEYTIVSSFMEIEKTLNLDLSLLKPKLLKTAKIVRF